MAFLETIGSVIGAQNLASQGMTGLATINNFLGNTLSASALTGSAATSAAAITLPIWAVCLAAALLVAGFGALAFLAFRHN